MLIEENSFKNFFNMIFSFTTVISSMIALCSTSIWIAILSIIFSVLMFIVPSYMTKKLQNQAQIFSEAQEKFTTESKVTLLGHEVFYSYNLLNQLTNKINLQ